MIAETNLERLAFIDQLTGTMTRNALISDYSEKSLDHIHFIYVDIDNFGFEGSPTRRGVSMSVQIIEKNGQPEWAVVPYEEYQRLVAEAEMLQDVREYDEARQALVAGEEELIPQPTKNPNSYTMKS